jgi:uncharacterized Zn-finger protein
MLTETSPSLIRGSGLSKSPPITTASVEAQGSRYPKFRNDRGVPEICIGVRGHPHIYINMGGADTILGPYSGRGSAPILD